jgi:hypothetical protein
MDHGVFANGDRVRRREPMNPSSGPSFNDIRAKPISDATQMRENVMVDTMSLSGQGPVPLRSNDEPCLCYLKLEDKASYRVTD